MDYTDKSKNNDINIDINIEEIKKKLQQMLSPKRYSHSVNVMDASVILAERYGENREKAALVGLVHDCARKLDKIETIKLCDKYGIIPDKIMQSQPELLHGIVGSHLARDLFGVACPRVLAAVAEHTMGREGMDKLSSIVFIADYIETGRKYPGVDGIRAAALKSLEEAIVAGLDNTIVYRIENGGILHPQTIATRNWALEQLKDTERNGDI